MTSFWGSKVVIRAAKIPIRPPKRVSKKGSFGPLGPLRSGSEGLISGYEHPSERCEYMGCNTYTLHLFHTTA